MKVLWVYFDIGTGNDLHYHHGVGDIDAGLRKRGHETTLLYLRQPMKREAFLQAVNQADPGVIFFPCTTHQWMHVRQVAAWIKQHHDRPCVAGGIHVICSPDEVIEHQAIDFICPWEGDQAVPELVDCLERHGDVGSVKGIWSKRNGQVHKTEPRSLVEDLDALPLSDRSPWDMRRILVDAGFEMGIMAGRGCPYRCTYCANSARLKAYQGLGKYVRMRTPARVIENIERLEARYYFKTLFFEDDIFTLDRSWVYDFLQRYKARFSYPFKVYIRIGHVDRSLLKELRDAGCYMVMAGVESGNEAIRADLLKRDITDEQLVRVFRWCDDLGLKTWTFNMAGFPGENERTLEELFSLHQRLRPNGAQLSLFYPYPKTELFDLCKSQGLLSDREQSSYFEHSVLNLPTVHPKRLEQAFWDFRDMTLRIRANKERKGELDLLDSLPKAKFQSHDPNNVRLHLTKVWGDERLSLLMHPHAHATWHVRIGPSTRFKAAVALDPVCLDWGGKGVRFQVRCMTNQTPRLLYDRYIDPKSDPNQNRWHEIDLPLSHLEGEANLTLATLPHESGDLVGAWGVWANPHLASER